MLYQKKYHNIEFCANNRPKSVNNIAVRVLTCNSVGLSICMTTSMMSHTVILLRQHVQTYCLPDIQCCDIFFGRALLSYVKRCIINLKVFNLKLIILIFKNKKLTILSKNIFFNMENHNES